MRIPVNEGPIRCPISRSHRAMIPAFQSSYSSLVRLLPLSNLPVILPSLSSWYATISPRDPWVRTVLLLEARTTLAARTASDMSAAVVFHSSDSIHIRTLEGMTISV